MVEDPNFNMRSQEELIDRLEALRHRAIEERTNFQDDRIFVFHVFTFQDPANSPARMVAHLRASLFAQDVKGGSIFEVVEKSAFVVDVGIMTGSEYEQYQSKQVERDGRLSSFETEYENGFKKTITTCKNRNATGPPRI